MTNPIYAYSHSATGCAAITGGAFVPNGAWPAAYDGAYLYGDYTCGKIFQLVAERQRRLHAHASSRPASARSST